MTKLSVNLNKVALIRNSRVGNLPDLIKFALDCEEYGAQGITIHPRPDERHARYTDVAALKAVVATELNIEGYPTDRFMDVVLTHCPHQCTLVPDAPDALTSDAGWNTVRHRDFLKDVVTALRAKGIRVSLFVDPEKEMIEHAALTGADRIEFYTGPYAHDYGTGREKAIEKYVAASVFAHESGLGVNAGHDLNLVNLKYFKERMPYLDEVSIGHALISDALYLGIHNTISLYLNKLV